MSYEVPQGPYLTVAEVAKMLKLTEQTIRNWIEGGTLPAIRAGRRVRIKSTELDRFLANDARFGARVTPSAGSAGSDADAFWDGVPTGVAEVDPDFVPGASK